ncbi:unnamed protein product [Brassica oleracea]
MLSENHRRLSVDVTYPMRFGERDQNVDGKSRSMTKP